MAKNMNDHPSNDHAHGGPNPAGVHQAHPPYWKRAHHDWRFWIAAIFIFAAMTIYVLTVELVLQPGRPPPAQPPDLVVK